MTAHQSLIQALNELSHCTKDSIRVVDIFPTDGAYIPLDLSSNGFDYSALSSSQDWEEYINKTLSVKNAQVAYGGYLEKRDLYTRSESFSSSENKRNIHLGVDLWCDAGTAVLAALDGKVHSFQDNAQVADYGPTIILEHSYAGNTFHSLYGHLSRDSLENLAVGQIIQQGETIAKIGRPEVNGDYAPHLHFQIIVDMQNWVGDYPGVCSEKELEFYKKNCPDPNLLLRLS